MKRVILALFISSIAVLAHAADVTRPQPRKKFKLHALSMGLKALPANLPKSIDRPAIESIGVMVQQEPFEYMELLAYFEPQLTLPSDRFTWSGGITGQGQNIQVGYASEGNRVVNLTVDDKNADDKVRSASIRVRFVSATREIDLCNPLSPTTFPLCPTAYLDGTLAADWAHSETANVQWHWLPPVTATDNGRANAAQHSYWNVLMTRDLGAANARMFADAHEREPARAGFGLNGPGNGTPGAPHNGTAMDLDNNAKGRQLAGGIAFESSYPNNDIDGQNTIIQAVLNGDLTVLDDAAKSVPGDASVQWKANGNFNLQGLLLPSNQGN